MEPNNKPTVLVSENQCIIRLSVCEFLESEGFRVIATPDGLQADRILSAGEDVQLLFSDVRMPEMDGLTLARNALGRSPHLGILLTSCVEPVDLPKDVLFLAKPYDTAYLSKRLRQMLSESEQA